MATDSAQPLRGETQGRIRGDTEGRYAARTSSEDREGHRRRLTEEVQQRQAQLSGSAEVHAARRSQAVGEHAHALGVGSRGQGAIPYQRLLDAGQRDTSRHRTNLSRSVVDHVGCHAPREERPEALQEDEVPAIR